MPSDVNLKTKQKTTQTDKPKTKNQKPKTKNKMTKKTPEKTYFREE